MKNSGKNEEKKQKKENQAEKEKRRKRRRSRKISRRRSSKIRRRRSRRNRWRSRRRRTSKKQPQTITRLSTSLFADKLVVLLLPLLVSFLILLEIFERSLQRLVLIFQRLFQLAVAENGVPSVHGRLVGRQQRQSVLVADRRLVVIPENGVHVAQREVVLGLALMTDRWICGSSDQSTRNEDKSRWNNDVLIRAFILS